jgi:epoxyqueuosine reductase
MCRPTVGAADADALKRAIQDKARALGFGAAGIADATVRPAAREALARFVEAGWHGDMVWLAERIDERSDPRVLWPGARSVVAVALNYAPHTDPLRLLTVRDRAAISTYARGRDYHDVLKNRLKRLGGWIARTAGCEVKVFVDTAPVMEKPLAAAAGIGWQGKHTNLVSRGFGSWLFLGIIYTDVALPPDEPETDRCGTCRRCLDACPTGALPAPYKLDARCCISYLTIEHEGPIPEDLRPLLGNRIYGCDDCLAVCPWNRFAKASRDMAFMPRIELTAPRLADFAQLVSEEDFAAVFAGSPVKRIGRDRFLRNVLVAIGNSGDSALMGVVERLRGDSSPVVAEAADWAAARLRAPGGG